MYVRVCCSASQKKEDWTSIKTTRIRYSYTKPYAFKVHVVVCLNITHIIECILLGVLNDFSTIHRHHHHHHRRAALPSSSLHFTLSFVSFFFFLLLLFLLPFHFACFSLFFSRLNHMHIYDDYQPFTQDPLLFLLKPGYFNCAHCLVWFSFFFFCCIFTFFWVFVCAKLNWSVGGDSTDVLLNSLKFNISEVLFLRTIRYKRRQIAIFFHLFICSCFSRIPNA